jgi:MFS family permease
MVAGAAYNPVVSIPLGGRVLPLGAGTFRALRHRDFRLLWTGQVVSLTGRWMQSVAQGWLVLRLSGSPFALGFVGFCSFLPILLFGLVAGAVADRWPRRPALLWTQGTAMGFAFVLAALTWLDLVRVSHVAALAFGVGLSGAFDIPIRQSLLHDLVGRDDLPNAIALNSLAFNGARLVGPALAGFLLAAFGEAFVFLLNGLSYLAVLVGLVRMEAPASPAGHRGTWVGEIRTGLGWVRRNRRARVLLLLVTVSSVFGLPYSILLPVFARDVLGVGSTGLGLMMGATGLGAVCGALVLAGDRLPPRRRGTIIGTAMAVLGVALMLFALSRTFWASMVLLVGIGAAMLVQLASTNTRLQLLAPDDLRGRIVSLYMLAFMGTAPIGSLLAGWAARAVGTPAAVLAGGAVCTAAAAGFLLRLPALRRAEEAAGPALSAAGSRRRSRSGP